MENKKSKMGIVASLFLIVFSIAFLFFSFDLSYTGRFGPGPGFFPVWLSVLLLIASVFYLYESIKGNNASEESMPKGKELKRIVFVILPLLLFIILLPLLGFIVTSVIFLFILLYKAYKWYLNLGISVLIAVFMFWLFKSVLGVALPVNMFGW